MKRPKHLACLALNRSMPRLLLLLFLLFSFSARGQNISYSAKNKSLKQVLQDLEKLNDLHFSFNPDQIKAQSNITIEVNNTDIQTVLGQILASTNLSFEVISENFIVIKKVDARYIQLIVQDGKTGEGLPFTNLRLVNSDLGKVADQDGKLEIIVPNPNQAQLELSFLGFKDTIINVMDIPEKAPFSIKMKEATVELSDFEVKEYLNVGIASNPMASSFRILPQEMEILPGLVERDVLLSSQIISGVNSNDESAGGINVRGGSRDQTSIYFNDIPIYHSAHYFGNISSFIPSVIGSLDVYKNFIPVEYGGATSGLLVLKSRNIATDSLIAESSITMTHADLMVTFPTTGNLGNLMIAGRTSINNIFSTPTFESFSEKLFVSEVTTENTTIRDINQSDELGFSDININWNFRPNSRLNFASTLFRSGSDFHYRSSSEEINDGLEQKHHVNALGASGIMQYRLNDNHSVKASLSFSDYRMAYDYVNRRNANDDSDDDSENRVNDLSNLELKLLNIQNLKNKSTLLFGYQMNYIYTLNKINQTFLLEEDSDEDIKSKGLVHAVFGELTTNLSPNLEVIVGARSTYLSTASKAVFAPQLKANYSLSPQLIFKSAFGIYYQYLSTIKESEKTLTTAIEQHWLLADDEALVPLIKNTQTSVGFIYQAKSWLIDTDFYHKNLNGILARNLGFDVNNLLGFETGTEEIWGFDLTVRRRWANFRTWLNYNYQDSKVSFDENFLSTFSSSLNLKHQLRLSTTYSLKRFEFSLGYLIKSGLPYSNTNGFTLTQHGGGDDDGDLDDGSSDEEFYVINYSDINRNRLKQYNRLDASVWYKIQSQKSWKAEVGFSALNILNRKNEFSQNYSIGLNSNEEPTIVQRKKYLLSFTPNLSFRVSF
jgi:hypothetical protein